MKDFALGTSRKRIQSWRLRDADADGAADDVSDEEPAKKSSRGGRGRGQQEVAVAAAETTVESSVEASRETTVEASAETTVEASMEGVVGDSGNDSGGDIGEDISGDIGGGSDVDIGGDIGGSSGGRGPDKAPRKARQAGAKSMYSTEIIAKLCHAFDEEMREHIDGCIDEAGVKAIHYEGTCERAGNDPSGIISLQLKAKLLTAGLCD